MTSSGGQKVRDGVGSVILIGMLTCLGQARLSLARAIYSSAQTLLLDDVCCIYTFKPEAWKLI